MNGAHDVRRARLPWKTNKGTKKKAAAGMKPDNDPLR
jgi:hypothetical protein